MPPGVVWVCRSLGVQAEHRSQGIRQLAAAIAADRQPAASLGSVRGEGGDDQSPPGDQRPLGKADVGRPFAGLDQEMEHGTVVPDVEVAQAANARHITHDPLHATSLITKPPPRDRQSGLRDVEHGHALKVEIQQVVHQ